MPTPFDAQRQQMGQRMMGSPPGGMGAGAGMPPPQAGPQQPPGGGSSRLEPLLQQVMQILVEGNPADIEAFGKFMGELNQLVESHNQGQGAPQGQPPMGGGMPQGQPPTMGGM